ncbi:sensor histidine kinase [Saccharothrix lopnurensis]|uniref:histidine kinase n=1 Tax=Saccharothrix lopnurensis TaxID=1670621 RepID=A0ABW1NYC8_9PSEU
MGDGLGVGGLHRGPGDPGPAPPRTALALATAVVPAATALPAVLLPTGVGVLVCAFSAATLLPPRSAALVHAVGGVLSARRGGNVQAVITNDGTGVVDLVTASAGTFALPGLIGLYARVNRAYATELAARVDDLVASARNTGMDVALTVRGDERPLEPVVDVAAYRLVQEALTNARQHAGATPVAVEVEFRASGLRVAVRNAAGRTGFGPRGGHGLAGMGERVRPRAAGWWSGPPGTATGWWRRASRGRGRRDGSGRRRPSRVGRAPTWCWRWAATGCGRWCSPTNAGWCRRVRDPVRAGAGRVRSFSPWMSNAWRA